MGRARQSEEVAALTAPVDLSQPVVYFPVRHHSPACAWHVARLIRELRPRNVLIEGPRDATPLIPLLVHPETQMPIALYATYVRRQPKELPDRHAAYYPLCDFSPELAAIRAALEVGANAAFIDLTFPEKTEHILEAESKPRATQQQAQNLQQEAWYSHSALLKSACVRTGTRDADDLWDHLYEVDYQRLETAEFIRGVLAFCQLARRDHTQRDLVADGCLAREQAMAAAIAEQQGTTVVVTGGFHTVALPNTKPKKPKRLKVKPDDQQLVLMRYSFDQLDRLNGYASGMPSPEYYQRMWEGRDATEILVEVARLCRCKNLGTSTADALAAVSHAQGLAQLRGHQRASREDTLDAVRSVMIKGAEDAEGIPVLAIARKLLAGDRVGRVPAEAGQPPIVHDFNNVTTRLRLKVGQVQVSEVTLDLYRNATHRDISRLMHRLTFLNVPFATFVRGPDFVAGEDLERIQEVWTYCWSPDTESSLIERSLYGSTIEEAASNRLLECFEEAQSHGQGRSAALATQLVLQACRMGLHRHTAELLSRVGSLITEDASFDSLVTAMENLLVLEVSREPLEAHHLDGLPQLATAAYHRACFLIPSLVAVPPEEEANVLSAMNALCQAVRSLGDGADLRDLRSTALAALAATTGGSAAVRGGACGLLHGDGLMDQSQLMNYLRGHVRSAHDGGVDGPNFLRGLLYTARHVLWQIPDVLETINEALADWDEEQFIRLLPSFRLALANLTPTETNAVAARLAAMLGVESKQFVTRLPDIDDQEMLRAVEINRQLLASLAADGLEAMSE